MNKDYLKQVDKPTRMLLKELEEQIKKSKSIHVIAPQKIEAQIPREFEQRLQSLETKLFNLTEAVKHNEDFKAEYLEYTNEVVATSVKLLQLYNRALETNKDIQLTYRTALEFERAAILKYDRTQIGKTRTKKEEEELDKLMGWDR